MSFTYGGVNSDSLAGVRAMLESWPSMGGLSVETTDIPGADGVVFGGQTRSTVEFTFNVTVQGESVDEAYARRDQFVALLDPSRGPRALTLPDDDGWVFPEVLAASGIEWTGYSLGGGATLLQGQVLFTTVGAASARQRPLESVTGEAVTFTQPGNTAGYPRVEFPVNVPDVNLQVNGQEWSLTGLPIGQWAVMDFDQMRFHLLDGEGGARVGSLVPHMDHYARAKVQSGTQAQIALSPPVTLTVYPNGRRI